MRVCPDAVFRRLLALIVLSVSAGLITQGSARVFGHDHLLGFVRFFDLDGESNFPTWLSSSALLLCALVLAAIAWLKSAVGDPFRRHWWGLSIVSLYLSLDETAMLHDDLIVNFIGRIQTLPGSPHLRWIPIGLTVSIVFLVCYWRFWRALAPRARRQMMAAAACYVGGALGMETIGGAYASRHGIRTFDYALLVACEEGLEMLGIALYLRTVLRYYRDIELAATQP